MVEVFVFFIILLLLAWFFLLPANKKKKKFIMDSYGEETLKKVCRQLNASCNEQGTSGHGIIEGIPYVVKIEHNVSFVVVIDHRLDVDGWVEIKKENMISRLKKDFGKEDFLVGGRIFDEAMLLTGENSHDLAALLSSNNRKLLLALSKKASSLIVSQSGIVVSLDDLSVSVGSLAALIKKTIYLSRDLTTAGNDQKRIIHNILSDPVPQVRLTNLKILGSHYPPSKELEKVYEKALNGSHAEIQMEAAALLKKKGIPHVVKILTKKKKNIPVPVILKGLKLLQEECFLESSTVLKDLYNKRIEPEISIAILKTFETFGDDELSKFLAVRLYEPDDSLLIHIIKALGTCGKVDVLEKLNGIAKNANQSKIREEANNAMARIRDRYGIDKGWLSVAEHTDADGALSMAGDEAEGGLSLKDEKDSEK